MSRSYKKTPINKIKGNYGKFMQNYSNRCLRRNKDHESFPRGNTNRVRYWNVDPWDVCDCSWRQSFEQWMVDREREYSQALEVVTTGWGAYACAPAGSECWKSIYDDYGRFVRIESHVREKDEWYPTWRLQRACETIAKGRPSRRKEFKKWRKEYLRK